MCGIAGIHYRDPRRNVAEDTLRKMCRAIEHRGPDDEGWFTDGNFGMAMRRLAVVDLESGRQPIANEDETVTVVYNGEIYNYPELKRRLEGLGHRFRTRSDTEVLVHGYEAWGEDLPRQLNGMFAFSVWDSRRRRLMLARDHIGVKPLYIYEEDQQIAWASEIKALLAAPGVQAELDEQALFDFLRCGYVPAPRTMFRRIRKVEPASVVLIERVACGPEGQVKIRRQKYWQLQFPAGGEPTRSVQSWSDELRQLLDDAVGRQLMSDVPLGAFLSGGLDSSSIVATMSRLGVERISTYAIGFGAEDAFHNELGKAAKIAQKFDTDHHEIVVEPNVSELLFPLIRQLDEPFTDTSFLVTYLVSQLARETVTVILSGVGGDEIFGGYRRYLGPRLQNYYKRVPGAVRRRLVEPLARRLPVDRGSAVKSLFRYLRGFAEQASSPEDLRYQGYVCVYNGDRASILSPEMAELEATTPSDQIADFYRQAPTNDSLNRMLYADLHTSLVDSLLAFTDKMSMAVSLEARVPLLDYRLVEFAAKVPPELKLRGFRGMKYIFKHAMQDRLPREILHQKKQGFGTPISRWFRGDGRSGCKDLLLDLLSPQQISQRGYFQPQAVGRMIDDHMRQRADYSEHLLALMTFEAWHQAYLD